MTPTITGSGQARTSTRRPDGDDIGLLARSIVALGSFSEKSRSSLRRATSAAARIVRPLGWAAVIAVVASFVAGYVLGWAEAVLFAWAGLLVLVGCTLSLLGSTAHIVAVTMPTPRVVVGGIARGLVTARNPGSRRLPALRIEVPVGEGIVELVLPPIPGGDSRSQEFDVPTTRRGIMPLGPARTVRADPVGLLRREVVWSGSVDLYVHPRTVSIPSVSAGYIRDLEGTPTRDLTASDISFHALREYVPGDEPRAIHWKSSARTGSLMVRQFEQTRRSHLLVALSTDPGDFADADEFELAVSVAGSLGVRAIRDGRTTTVTTGIQSRSGRRGERHLPAGSPVRLLDSLCGVETAPESPGIDELARAAAEGASDVSLAFLVCGSAVPATLLRGAAQRFRPGVDVMVVQCRPGHELSLQRHGELNVLTLGVLGDLRAGMARAAA